MENHMIYLSPSISHLGSRYLVRHRVLSKYLSRCTCEVGRYYIYIYRYSQDSMYAKSGSSYHDMYFLRGSLPEKFNVLAVGLLKHNARPPRRALSVLTGQLSSSERCIQTRGRYACRAAGIQISYHYWYLHLEPSIESLYSGTPVTFSIFCWTNYTDN